MSPNSASSPVYNPVIERYNTPNPYSPIIDNEMDDDIPKNVRSSHAPYSPTSPIIYTPNNDSSVYNNNIKSPYVMSGGQSRSFMNSAAESSGGSYSPSNIPVYGTSHYSKNNTPRYKQATSPGYASQVNNMSSHGNYSPSTSMYIKNSNSPDYNYKGSNYSGGSSPRINESGGSPGSQQRYSPKSPIYNSKSPSYGQLLGKF